MQNFGYFQQNTAPWQIQQRKLNSRVWRRGAVGLLLVVALFAFEVFNYDSTRFALGNLLGNVSFAGFRWAAILAIAFCAIDFAGLAYLFSPEREEDGAQEVWYLMGAWLLGATMNALMTWWAVSVTLLSHEFGNEVLNREQLLELVPPFVAVLVWLTRILFIGAFSAAGNRLFAGEDAQVREDEPTGVARPLPDVSRAPSLAASRAQARSVRRGPAPVRPSLPPSFRPAASPLSAAEQGSD